jgi:hypothetical protein
MATSRVKISNSSDIPEVRFRGTHFQAADDFNVTLSPGSIVEVKVAPGSIGLVAFRISDEVAVGHLAYPATPTQGFAAVLINHEDHYLLVGEPFVIEG